MTKQILTYEEAHRLFRYEPETGYLYNRVTRWLAKTGCRAGSFNKHAGYIEVSVNGKSYWAHRVIWLMTHGEWPNQIDHINHKRHDNRLINLRAATAKTNRCNQSLRGNNTSGVCGVGKADGKWTAYITINGVPRYLGRHTDKFEAICIRKSAEAKHGFHRNHGAA